MDKPSSLPEIAFTIHHAEIVDAIFTEAKIALALDENPSSGDGVTTKALWDTGATNTCISDRLARKLSLEAVDFAHVATASGIEHVPTYLAHVFLPKGLVFKNWELMQFQYTDDESDLIIGMDIITKGDFSITNFDGRTVCSFRIPSQHLVDFEEG